MFSRNSSITGTHLKVVVVVVLLVVAEMRVEGRREEEVAYVECLLPLSGGEEGEEEGFVRNPSLTIKSFKIIFFLSFAFK